jgi:RNA polymerase sigma-70 factor (ECF subfamily)
MDDAQSLEALSDSVVYVMSDSEPSSGRGVNFATTRWSLVISVSAEDVDSSRSALEWLCRAYWMPLYAYVRRRVSDVHDAQDLTQAFFERLLEKDYLADADPNRGRFRSFLLTSFKHFLANEWDKRKAKKRGGGQHVMSLDFSAGDSWHASLPSSQLTAEKLFERQWANTILTRVMRHLEREQERAGNARQFERLKRFIGGRSEATSIAGAAAQLGMTESAARMAVSRLRDRYRDLLRAEISETVASSLEIDEEISHLFSVFSA